MLRLARAASRAAVSVLHPAAGRARVAAYDSSFERRCRIPAETATGVGVVSVPARAEDGDLPRLHALAVIAARLQPRRVFEFGTFRGDSALVFAHNSAADVFTLDLPPGELVEANHFDAVLMAARDEEGWLHERVHRLYGDSRSFDVAPYAGSIDLVYVDGGHDEDVVAADTASAFELVAAGGTIVWDDYGWMHPRVVAVLDELHASQPSMRRVTGTRLVVLHTD